MNSGSCFLAEIRRMVSSFKPLGTRSSSILLMNPHLYSRSARSRIVSTFVLICYCVFPEVNVRLGMKLPVLVLMAVTRNGRSEEHTSELQSLRHFLSLLLLEKK